MEGLSHLRRQFFEVAEYDNNYRWNPVYVIDCTTQAVAFRAGVGLAWKQVQAVSPCSQVGA
jgi:hypothetical protein